MQHNSQRGTNQQPSGASCTTTLNPAPDPAKRSLASDESQTLDLKPSLPAEEAHADKSQHQENRPGILPAPQHEGHLAALFDAAEAPEAKPEAVQRGVSQSDAGLCTVHLHLQQCTCESNQLVVNRA